MKKGLLVLFLLITGFAGFSQSDTSTVLQGKVLSHAVDATIVSTVWTQLSGKQVTIESPNTLQTKISGLTAGEYKFSLKITDSYGSFGTKETEVIVLRYDSKPVADVENSRIVIQLKK